MEVRNGFAGVRAGVHDEAKAFGEIQFFRDDSRDDDEMTKLGFVCSGGFAHAGNELFRDDQQMDGRLRLDVVENDAVLVFIFDFSGDIAVDDALENGFGHGLFTGGNGENGDSDLEIRA